MNVLARQGLSYLTLLPADAKELAKIVAGVIQVLRDSKKAPREFQAALQESEGASLILQLIQAADVAPTFTAYQNSIKVLAQTLDSQEESYRDGLKTRYERGLGTGVDGGQTRELWAKILWSIRGQKKINEHHDQRHGQAFSLQIIKEELTRSACACIEIVV